MITSINQQNINYKGIKLSKINDRKDVLKNKFKILSSQDIFAPIINVKLPESKLEKTALIEVLQNRLKIEKLTKLKNKYLSMSADYDLYKELREINPNSKECIELKKALDKGSTKIKDYLRLLEHKIKIETKKHEKELNYFDNLKNLEEEYFEKGILREEELEKFYNNVQKNGINTENSLSTRDLLEIVEKNSPTKKNLFTIIKEKVTEIVK